MGVGGAQNVLRGGQACGRAWGARAGVALLLAAIDAAREGQQQLLHQRVDLPLLRRAAVALVPPVVGKVGVAQKGLLGLDHRSEQEEKGEVHVLQAHGVRPDRSVEQLEVVAPAAAARAGTVREKIRLRYVRGYRRLQAAHQSVVERGKGENPSGRLPHQRVAAPVPVKHALLETSVVDPAEAVLVFDSRPYSLGAGAGVTSESLRILQEIYEHPSRP